MARAAELWAQVTTGLNRLQDPLLLVIRAYWAWSLMWNGWGKLHHLPQIAKWFGEDLHIPFPMANAFAAGTTEFLGSLAVLVGLASRPAAAAIAFTMTVAFLTSDRAAVASLGTDFFCYDGQKLGDCFTLAAPFPYWFMAVIVVVFGPGKVALDTLVERWWKQRSAA